MMPLCGGCFVIDEIDQGRALMEEHNPGPATATEATGSDGTPKSARERLNEYYAKQRAKASSPAKSEDASDAVGKCRIGGSVQFMRRTDCNLRGGTFL
jgi:hypothetical protein